MPFEVVADKDSEEMRGLLADVSQETMTTSLDSSEAEDIPYVRFDELVPLEDVPEDGGSGMSIIDGVLLCLGVLIIGFGIM